MKNSINLTELDSMFKGLVIGYNNDVPVGYVTYTDNMEEVAFTSDANIEDCEAIHYAASLLKLINLLIKDKICANFKVLEFGN